MHRQFTLLRLMLAVTVFAFFFGILNYWLQSGITYSHRAVYWVFYIPLVMISGSLAGIVLVSNGRDVFETIIPTFFFFVVIVLCCILIAICPVYIPIPFGFIICISTGISIAFGARRVGRRYYERRIAKDRR
jgi:hypothetical protein